MPKKLELVAPAGTPAALEAALRAGADAIYAGFRDETNARNFPGLNFSLGEMAEGTRLAHRHGAKLYVAINTYPSPGETRKWHRAIAAAEDAGADAVILADIGLCEHAARRHPSLRRHLSVQASAATPEAISFYRNEFGISRVVLPRVLSIKDIAALIAETGIETEVFAFGGLCTMAEGRCALSGQACGISPNRAGVCSPASAAHFTEDAGETTFHLGPFALNRFTQGENPGYPTVCKGRYLVDGKSVYAFEEPRSLDIMPFLGELAKAGVTALKIEGRQRGRAYVEKVAKAFRKAIDGQGTTDLSGISEGEKTTSGAYLAGWQ